MLKISFCPKTRSRSLDLYRIVSRSNKSSSTGSVLSQIGTFSVKNNFGNKQAQMFINSESLAKQAYYGATLTKSAIRAFNLSEKRLECSQITETKNVKFFSSNARCLCGRPSIYTVGNTQLEQTESPSTSSIKICEKPNQQVEFENYIVDRRNLVYFRNFYADVAFKKGLNVNHVSDRWSYPKKYLYGFFSAGNLWFYYSAHIIFLSTFTFFIVTLLLYNNGDIIHYLGIDSFFDMSNFYIDLPYETSICLDIFLKCDRDMCFITIDKITFKPVNNTPGYKVLFYVSKYSSVDKSSLLQSSIISFNQFEEFGMSLDTFFKAGIKDDQDLVSQIMSTFKSKKLTIDCISPSESTKLESLKSINRTFDILSNFGVKISEISTSFETKNTLISKTSINTEIINTSQFLIEDVVDVSSTKYSFLKNYGFGGNISYLLLLIKKQKFLFHDLYSYVKASRAMDLKKKYPKFVFVSRQSRVPGYNKRMLTKHFSFRNSDKYGRPNSKSKYGGFLARLQFIRVYTRLTGLRKNSDTQKRFWYSGWKSHFLKERMARFSLRTSENDNYIRSAKTNNYIMRQAFKKASEDIKLKNLEVTKTNGFGFIASLVDRLASGLSWNIRIEKWFLNKPKN